MLKIYAIPVSLYSAKLRILLRHKGLQWEEVLPPGGYGSDEYKTVVPSGNLPAMVDGSIQLADSEAIAEYLNEKHPARPMLPPGLAERGKARELSRFHDTRLEPELRTLFPFLPPATPDTSVSAAQSSAMSARLAQLERMLEPKKRHDQLTLGDCGFPITLTWIDVLTPIMGLNVVIPGRVREYREWLGEQQAVADELNGYRPKITAWLEGERAAQQSG